MKTFNTKKIIATILVSIILILALCLLPFPVRHKFTLQSAHTTKDEVISENVTISINVWNLHYLFKSKELKGTAEIALNDMHTSIELLGPIYQVNDETIFWTSIFYYNESYNRYCGGEIWFDNEFENFVFVIRDGNDDESYFVASRDENVEVADILEPFKKYISHLQ